MLRPSGPLDSPLDGNAAPAKEVDDDDDDVTTRETDEEEDASAAEMSIGQFQVRETRGGYLGGLVHDHENTAREETPKFFPS